MIEWQDSLTIGVLEIDIQHKLLFEKFNAFLAAYRSETDSDELYRLFWFLEAYAITHFKDEEKLMQEVGFPDYLKHRDRHLAFAGEIGKLKERLKCEGANRNLVSTMKLFISSWLVEHISNLDRAIAHFVNGTQIPAKP
jgi:hemerythrin